VTYNVWFELDFYDQRCEQIFKILECNKVDVICLQEVIPLFIEKLIKEKWIQDFYYLSNIQGDSSFVPFGSVLLSSIRPKSLKRWVLPSSMGRDCLVAEYLINGEEFAFGTTHLESLNYPQKRKEQLERISQHILHTYPNAILMGDFNFDSYQNYSKVEAKREALRLGVPPYLLDDMEFNQSEPLENDSLRILFPDFRDAWSECGLTLPEDKGYTYDSVDNTMIKQYERMRYDRILFKSKRLSWDATGICLLGTERLDPSKVGGAVVYPSDHFGLILTIERKAK